MPTTGTVAPHQMPTRMVAERRRGRPKCSPSPSAVRRYQHAEGGPQHRPDPRLWSDASTSWVGMASPASASDTVPPRPKATSSPSGASLSVSSPTAIVVTDSIKNTVYVKARSVSWEGISPHYTHR
uniref:Uncharacterized protein n=1 Tax=Triticum urartu TaxID=4572 RepID=A0A8R7QRQ9_TRIUA